MRVRRFAGVVAIGAALVTTEGLAAHRLDELLQAARIDVGRDRTELTLDLTPGIEIAPRVAASIDSDADGRVSDGEALAYVARAMTALEVDLDQQRVDLRSVSHDFPTLDALATGSAVIRMVLEASYATIGAGRHALTFRNMHEPAMSVYLANALVPSDGRVAVVEQDRDARQTRLSVHFDVVDPAPWIGIVVAAIIGAGVLGGVSWRRRSRQALGRPARRSPREH